MTLREKVAEYLQDTGVAVVAFCRKVNISSSYYYMWRNGKVEFSDSVCNRIEKYLKDVYAKNF